MPRCFIRQCFQFCDKMVVVWLSR